MISEKKSEYDDTVIIEEEVSEKEYHILKERIKQLRKKRKSKYILIFLLSLLLAFALFCVLSCDVNHLSIIGALFISGSIGIFVWASSSIGLYMSNDMIESRLQRRIIEYEAENMQNQINEDFFENSIKLSYKYLDQYYLQTREQAQKGFFITVCVAVFGALLIFVGIVAMFLRIVEPSYITCASGVITEFIAAIFFYLYNKTVSSMSKYHNKLVFSHNISIALKVADSLPTEDKTKTKNIIINELLKDINVHLVKNDL